MKEIVKAPPSNIVNERTPFFTKAGEKNTSLSENQSFFQRHGIQPKLEISQPGDIYEQEADKMADKIMTMPDPIIQRQKLEDEKILMKSISGESGGPVLQDNIEFNTRLMGTKGSGSPLPDETRASMEKNFGSDFSNVRLHTDENAANLNHDINAQAFTHGNDIYFGTGKYNSENSSGKHLLAHEMTHVVQQTGSVNREIIQRNLNKELPLGNGDFNINMINQNGAAPHDRAGMSGSIRFSPKTTAPYSNEIKLIQIIRIRDQQGKEKDPASLPAGRGSSLRTTEDKAKGIEGGFFTDVLHQNFNNSTLTPTKIVTPGEAKGLAYEGETPVFGFKRSDDPKDIRAAELQDSPNWNRDVDFTFETVAKGTDTNTVYGSLHWGFVTRHAQVKDEYARATGAQSKTFDAAVEKHRDFYVHEPVTIYFDFDSDVLTTEESSKIDTFLDYLKRFPDVQLSVFGFADKKGNAQYNKSLSSRRSKNVYNALIAKGISNKRIFSFGWGATQDFTSNELAPNPGQSQDLEANRKGNRRVEISFEHIKV